MNGLGATLIAFFAAMVLFGSRRVALLGLFGVVCYVPMDQQILVGAFHFNSTRIALLAGFVRVIVRGEYRALTLTGIDKALVAYVVAVTGISILREGTMSEVVFCFGKDYDMVLSYFVCRCLLPAYQDMKAAILSLAWLIVPLAILLVPEMRTGHNFFAVMGVHDEGEARHGFMRAQGPFLTPILAGVFGATLLPLFIGLYPGAKRRLLLLTGMGASASIAVSSVSGHGTFPCPVLPGVLAVAGANENLPLADCRRAGGTAIGDEKPGVVCFGTLGPPFRRGRRVPVGID
jgi:hypothetical protein